MQYILSEEEYTALCENHKRKMKLNDQQLQTLCTDIANKMPVMGSSKPWGCIHSTSCEWYCDDCPVQEICPEKNKRWA